MSHFSPSNNHTQSAILEMNVILCNTQKFKILHLNSTTIAHSWVEMMKCSTVLLEGRVYGKFRKAYRKGPCKHVHF
jgi:hypothetical protein